MECGDCADAIAGTPVEHLASNEVGIVERTLIERCAIGGRYAEFGPLPELGVRDVVDAFEFEHEPSAMHPERLDLDLFRLTLGGKKPSFPERLEPVRLAGHGDAGNLAAIG